MPRAGETGEVCWPDAYEKEADGSEEILRGCLPGRVA